MRKRAVLIRPSTGLGNQLFLYSAGLFLARNTHKKLYIDVSRLRSSHVSHGGSLESFALQGNFVSLSITGQLLDFFIPRVARFKSLANLLGIYVANGVGFQEDLEYRQETIRYLEGFFMSDEYVNSLKEDGLFNWLELKNPSLNYQELLQSQGEEAIILVHVRRGDFLINPNSWGILAEEYYLKAINMITSKGKRDFKIVVISDNINLVKLEFQSSKWNNSVFLETSQYDPADIMYLFTFANAIVIGNSTFSWWGSLFSNASIVVAPKPFYKASPEFIDLDRHDFTFIKSTWNQ